MNRLFSLFIVLCGGLLLLWCDAASQSAHSWKWVQKIGATQQGAVSQVRRDGAGNIYVAGTFNDSLEFSPRDSMRCRWQSVFIAKFNALGEFQWVRQIGDTTDLSDFVVAPTGAITVGGTFYLRLAFTPSDTLRGTTSDSVCSFIAQYSGDGVYQWSKRVSSIRAMTVDRDGVLYVGGNDAVVWYAPNGDVAGELPLQQCDALVTDPAGSLYAVTRKVSGDDSASIRKFYRGGEPAWKHSFNAGIYTTVVSCDSADGVFLVSAMWNNNDFGNGVRVSPFNFPIIVKFDSAGVAQWARRATSRDFYTAANDRAGNLYFVGATQDTAIFDIDSVSSENTNHLYVAKFSPAGKILRVLQLARSTSQFSDLRGWGVAVEDSIDIALCGTYNESTVFESTVLHANGQQDGFIGLLNIAHAFGATKDRVILQQGADHDSIGGEVVIRNDGVVNVVIADSATTPFVVQPRLVLIPPGDSTTIRVACFDSGQSSAFHGVLILADTVSGESQTLALIAGGGSSSVRTGTTPQSGMLTLVPQPATDHATVTLVDSTATHPTVIITDILGRTCAVGTLTPSGTGIFAARVELSALMPGIYVCETAGSRTPARTFFVVK